MASLSIVAQTYFTGITMITVKETRLIGRIYRDSQILTDTDTYRDSQ